MDNTKIKTGRYFSIFFIVLGLLISIGGILGCFMDKHYEGAIENYEAQKLITDSPTSLLCSEYIYNIGNIGSTLYYKFDDHNIKAIKGLSYTVDIGWLSFTVISSLAFLGFGIYAIKHKDIWFK